MTVTCMLYKYIIRITKLSTTIKTDAPIKVRSALTKVILPRSDSTQKH